MAHSFYTVAGNICCDACVCHKSISICSVGGCDILEFCTTCEERMQRLREERRLECIRLFKEGKYIRTAGMNHHNGKVQVLFVGKGKDSQHLDTIGIYVGDQVVGRFMTKKTYDRFHLSDLATLDEFEAIGELTPAPSDFTEIYKKIEIGEFSLRLPGFSPDRVRELRKVFAADQDAAIV